MIDCPTLSFCPANTAHDTTAFSMMCCSDFVRSDPFKITSASNITQIPHVVCSIDRASHCRQPVGPVFPCSASNAHSLACRFPPRQARRKRDPRVRMLLRQPCGECLMSVGCPSSRFSHALMSSVWNTVRPYLSPSVLLQQLVVCWCCPALNLRSGGACRLRITPPADSAASGFPPVCFSHTNHDTI